MFKKLIFSCFNCNKSDLTNNEVDLSKPETDKVHQIFNKNENNNNNLFETKQKSSQSQLNELKKNASMEEEFKEDNFEQEEITENFLYLLDPTSFVEGDFEISAEKLYKVKQLYKIDQMSKQYYPESMINEDVIRIVKPFGEWSQLELNLFHDILNQINDILPPISAIDISVFDAPAIVLAGIGIIDKTNLLNFMTDSNLNVAFTCLIQIWEQNSFNYNTHRIFVENMVINQNDFLVFTIAAIELSFELVYDPSHTFYCFYENENPLHQHILSLKSECCGINKSNFWFVSDLGSALDGSELKGYGMNSDKLSNDLEKVDF